MAEELYPLAFPPGLYHNGTKTQASGRWYDGNGVRFHQGTIGPIGGWVQRTLTGAAIAGVPNAAIAWSDNAGNAWLAIGTTTKLYVVSSANVVYDITPTTGFNTGGNPVFWQLETFGSYLVAVYNGPGTNPTGAVNVFSWTGDTATIAAQVVPGVLDSPFNIYGIVTTPERFLFMLRGDDPATLGTAPTKVFRAARAGATATDMVN